MGIIIFPDCLLLEPSGAGPVVRIMHTIRGTGLSSIPRSTSVADLLSAAANLVRMGATKVGENELAYKSDYKRKRVEKGYQART